MHGNRLRSLLLEKKLQAGGLRLVRQLLQLFQLPRQPIEVKNFGRRFYRWLSQILQDLMFFLNTNFFCFFFQKIFAGQCTHF
uniref:Uncharacterized protein n=1 Tax=Romanomermis culicivorax TaxID=13658 RepID=A0A915HKC3_ROMCU